MNTSDSPLTRFDEWLARVEKGEALDFEAFCGPQADPSLVKLKRLYDAVRANGGGPPIHDRIRERFGSGADPEVSLEADPGSGTDAVLIESLKERGPTSVRYRLHDEIARGGMGMVLQVFDRDLRRNLAMKVMLEDPSGTGGRLSRFLEEAQVTGQLDHPGIVPVHELGLDPHGKVYFTMKLVKGETLSVIFDKVLDGVDGWNQTRALSVLLRVCEAMAFAHEKGVIHRDLKPANVMVGRHGETYVMDWGLARVLGKEDTKDIRIQPGAAATEVSTARRESKDASPDSPLYTADGDAIGTPSYMPPEQAEGRIAEIGPHSDVYAVGAMLYRLLAGTDPYVEPGTRPSGIAILHMVLLGPPDPVHRFAPHAQTELLAICEKAMARKIAARYATMTALADDLRAYLERRVVKAYATGAAAEMTKWVQRNPWLAASGAALVLVLVAATATVSAKNRDLSFATSRANANAAIAKDAAAKADAERLRVLRLSDVKRLQDLLDEMDDLWPSFPEKVDAMERWLGRARELVARLPEHDATLAELRSHGTPREHPQQAGLDALLAQIASDPDTAAEVDAKKARHDLESQAVAIEAEIVASPEYGFEDEESAWWHATLSRLVANLRSFAAADESGSTIGWVDSRLSFARTIEDESIGKHRKEWDETIAAIAADPRYAGLHLTPQIGLVPIGRDPQSQLFEFWHVQTGARPMRDERGRIVVSGDMGLVFVLIPGGTFFMGAQAKDSGGPNYDPHAQSNESDDTGRAVEVTLGSFLISKYEMTQGQWSRFAGSNPSQYVAGSADSGAAIGAANPVEQVSWNDCATIVRQLGLRLPTEAQWEYACRGGTSTPWWAGSEKSDLDEVGNLADAAAKRAAPSWNCDLDIDDGHVVHAAVGSFRANEFGLHDMIGNVWEWCRDGFTSYRVAAQAGDGERIEGGARDRVPRGGSFDSPPAAARSAFRPRSSPDFALSALGLRPLAPIRVSRP